MKIVKIDNKNKCDLLDFELLIRETEPEIWLNEFNAKSYKEKIEAFNFETEANIVLAMYDGKKIVGRCDLAVFTSALSYEKSVYLDWIYVEKNNRKKAIGKNLFDGAVKASRGLGAKELFLFTAGNDEAQAFYNSLDSITLSDRQVARLVF